MAAFYGATDTSSTTTIWPGTFYASTFYATNTSGYYNWPVAASIYDTENFTEFARRKLAATRRWAATPIHTRSETPHRGVRPIRRVMETRGLSGWIHRGTPRPIPA